MASFLELAAIVPMQLVISCPEGFEPDAER